MNTRLNHLVFLFMRIGENMRKLLVSLCSIAVIIIGLTFIDKLLKPDIVLEERPKTTESFADYDLYNFGDNFKTISINTKTFVDCNVDGVNLTYNNSYLTINEKEIADVTYLYSYFAIYGESLIVLGYTKDNTNYLYGYNYKTGEEKFITTYKEMLIDFKQEIIFEEVGIIVNFTFIKDNKHLKYKNDLCTIKDTDITVNRAVEYFYDSNTKFIGNNEELYSINLYSYLQKNNICS